MSDVCWGVNKIKRVILVTGTPCVGKTSVSKLLASHLHAKHIDLAKLVERERLISGTDEARGTLIADMTRLSRRVQQIRENWDGDVVIDGHYAVDVVSARDVRRVFVLRRDPEELKKLMEARGFREKKLWENLAVEILDVCLYDAVRACGQDKVCEIDATGKSVEAVVKETVSVLGGKKPCLVGIVDWLGKLERENLQDEFLKSF